VQQAVDDDRRHDDTSTEATGLDVAASHAFVRGGSRDAEDVGDFLDGVGGPVGVFVGVAHVRTVRNMTHSTANTEAEMTLSTATTEWLDHSHLEFVTQMARCVWSSVWLRLTSSAVGDVPPAGVARGSEHWHVRLAWTDHSW